MAASSRNRLAGVHKKVWWPNVRALHRAPFPLLYVNGPGVGALHPYRSITSQHFRVDQSVQAINQLAMAVPCSPSPSSKFVCPQRAPTTIQAAILEDICRRVVELGPSSADFTPNSALSEILRKVSNYSELPADLAGYDPAKLKIIAGNFSPKDPFALLPPEAAFRLRKWRHTTELSSEEVAGRLEGCSMPRPYMRPSLRRSRLPVSRVRSRYDRHCAGEDTELAKWLSA
jgi:hypothetical protein